MIQKLPHTIPLCVILFLTLVLAPSSATAQGGTSPTPPPGVRVEALVSPEDPFVGDQFQYIVRVEGAVMVEEVEFPNLTRIDALERVGNAISRSQNMFFNSQTGVSGTETRQTIVLRGLRPGNVTIPNARVRIQGRWFDAGPVAVNIREIPRSTIEGFESIISARTTNAQNNRVLENNYFALAEFPERIFRGQAVPVKIYIYRNPELPSFTSWEEIRDATARDFIIPNIPRNAASFAAPRWESAEFAGRPFLRAHINTVYVVPTRSGELLLKPPSTRIFIPASSPGRRSIPDVDLFRPQVDQVPALAEIRARTVDVFDPPAAPEGALLQVVGELTPSVTTDRTEVPEGELVTVRVSLLGRGFFDLVSAPTLPEIDGLRRVSQSSSGRNILRDGELFSSRDFEFIFQASRAGDVRIPEFTFAAFDPELGEQVIRRTEEIILSVQESVFDTAAVASVDAVSGLLRGRGRSDAIRLGADVSYIDRSPIISAALAPAAPFYLNPLFWFAQIIFLAGATVFGLARAGFFRNSGDEKLAARRQGRQVAEKALAEAQSALNLENKEIFYGQLSKGLRTYVAHMMHKNPATFSTEDALRALQQEGCGENTIAALKRVLSICDSIRYSPAPDNKATREQALSDAKAIITDLDRVSGGKK